MWIWAMGLSRLGVRTLVCGGLCALLASAARAQAPAELDALSGDALLTRLIELNDAARQRYDSLEFYARVTLSRPGQADRQIEASHIVLDKGRLRLEQIQESPLAAPGEIKRTTVLLRGPEYVADWNVDGATIQQYRRGADGQVSKRGQTWDAPHMGTPGIAWRLCGNGMESLSAYRQSRTDLVFRARPSGEPGVYVLSVDSDVEYTIDGPKGFVITRLVVSSGGRTGMEHVHTLGEIAPGVWFPSRMVERAYDQWGRVDNTRTTDFWDVRVNPPVTDRDFTIESLAVAPGTRLAVEHPDGRLEGFELPGQVASTAPAGGEPNRAGTAAAEPAAAPRRLTQPTKPRPPISSAELRGPPLGRYFIIAAAVSAAGALGLWVRSRRQQAP